jgi:hypothetical protein
MDNKVNEIRKKISALRAKMQETERAMQTDIAHGRDCAASAGRLMAQRMEMAQLAGARRALGDTAPLCPEPPRKLQLVRS